ncbi:GNAT family N-acetyltransferase [Aliivibrio fischeri]|nr:GNAT family N-acetyltransferase [Aliivibrio fischeri]MUK36152.1 GNAT family N-acetyltransferase [Aliivibrio fischeri]MUK44916.1 GNAT family N-acetyltransferase [Aliivibrio fischeri]MUK61760.1 GNAT family N-acetyltransferase [Aliivibrio fischeri]MUK69192.1 GNAT family N-acetyltransferase [Aliivibrio fischeri]
MIKKSDFLAIPSEEYKGILSLRYQVFKQRLEWDLVVENNLESDEYDNSNAEYIYACDDTENVSGCWRLLPTTGDYMLKSVFPELLGQQSAPKDPNIVELSRFAVGKNSSKINNSASEITMKLFEAIYKHAVSQGITEYVTVTSTAIERFLKRIKVPCHRIGDKEIHVLGDTKSVVLSMPINEQFKKAVLN